MSIFVMGSGRSSDLQWLNTNIPHVDIPINIWIQLIQNNFIGVNENDYEYEYFKQKYKIEFNSNIPKVVQYFKKCIRVNNNSKSIVFIFYHDNITRSLWENVQNTLTKLNKNCVVIGLTTTDGNKFKHDNILPISDQIPLLQEEVDKICRYLNQFLLKKIECEFKEFR